MISFRNLFVLCIVLLALPAFAQRGGLGGLRNIGQGGGSGGSSLGLVTRDTSDIFYFYADSPNLIFPFEDSLLNDFQQYDPIRLQPYDYASLGNLGSAHYPLFYQPDFRQGFDVGLHQFDLYQMKTSDVRFYKIEQAYTQAGYSQGQTQADAYTNIRFSRNFANGLNFSIEYRRIDNQGAYDNQRADNTDVAVGFWFHNKYDTYDGFFTFVNNAIEQQDNGGITNGADSVYDDAFRLDVNLLNSNTRYANREYAYTQYFYLNKIFNSENVKRRTDRRLAKKERREQRKEEKRLAKLMAKDSTLRDSLLAVDSLGMADSLRMVPAAKDSIAKPPPKPPNAEGKNDGPPGRTPTALDKNKRTSRPPGGRPPFSPQLPTAGRPSPALDFQEGRVFTLYHQIAWRTDGYKFSALAADSSYFGQFWVDDRGLRHFLETKKLQNTVKLQTFKLRKSTPDSTGRALPAQSDLLEVGLVHALHLIDQEPLNRDRLNNLFLAGNFNFSPNDRIRILTYAHLGIGANAGDFRLSGDLFFNLKKIGTLRLEAVNQLSTPSLLPRQFYLSEQQIWQNDFNKTLQTSLKAAYSLPRIEVALKGEYHLVNNLIYFDSEGLAQQDGSVISVLQLSLNKNFKAGPFQLHNWLGLQESTSNNLRLPNFYSRHSLFWEGRIFKKIMLTRVGFDARLFTGFTPYNYQPLTGQFFLQSDQDLPFTPLIDGFINFKVKTFRFFIKVENVLPLLTERYYFQTANYPLPFNFNDGGLRIGINWRLVD